MAHDVFRENVRDLLFTCGEYLSFKISQEVMLAMIDICKEKMELSSNKVVDGVLKDCKKRRIAVDGLDLTKEYFREASPEIQKVLKKAVLILERAAKKKKNPWDDALVAMLKTIIVEG